MYGDGSDGALNVTSGNHILETNRQYQFTTVDVASGAVGTAGKVGEVVYNSVEPPTPPRTHHAVKYYNGSTWVMARAKGSIQSEWKESIVEATLTE